VVFSFENIDFWIELLRKEIIFDKKEDNFSALTASSLERHRSVLKNSFLLNMLFELKFISKKHQRMHAVSSTLVFSCISENTMKDIGFRLFVLEKFYAESFHESDWVNISKAIYWDIRKNLPKKVSELECEHNLESNRKDLIELNEQLEKLEKEYKSYWLKNKKTDSEILNLKNEIKEKLKVIGVLEHKVLNNKILLDALAIGDDALFNANRGSNEFYGNNIESSLNESGVYNFDLVKIFSQLMSETLINYYNYEGEYSTQYALMINGLQEEMLKRVDKVVGYRLAEDIVEGDKDYPHVSRALMDTFIDSLDKEEGILGKKYFIKYIHLDQVKRIEINLKLVDGALMFQDNLAQGFYNSLINEGIINLENKKIIDFIKKKFSENELLVYEFLENLIKDINVGFLHPKRVSSSDKMLSDESEVYHIEHELIVYLSSALKKEGFIVSDKYFKSFIFNKKLQNLINARLKEVDNCVAYYLDTGLALPLLKTISPDQDIEEEAVAKKLLNEMLENPGNDRVSLLVSGTISNHASIRLENQIKAISTESKSFLGYQKSDWLERYIHCLFFGQHLSLPDSEMTYIDAQGRKGLNNQFIEKLKYIYKNETNKYKEDLIKKTSEILSRIQDNSIDSIAQWKERIKNAINKACYPQLYLREKVLEGLYQDIFSSHRAMFIQKFNMEKTFIEPSYPLDFTVIMALSNKRVIQLLAELEVSEGSPKYPIYYNALIKSYNAVLFEWECREIKKLLNQAIQELNLLTNKLTEKSYFELACDWIELAARTLLEAAAAVGGVGLLFGMAPQALLCLALLQALSNISPIMVFVLFVACYKYVLPMWLSDKSMALLKKAEAAVLYAFNMALLPLVAFLDQVLLLLALKFPKNREKLTKMLIAFVSALVGVVAFIFFPAIASATLVAGFANLGPFMLAYGAAAFTFFLFSFMMGVPYQVSLEEKIRELLVESLSIKDLALSELEFLSLFKEMEQEEPFLTEFKNFLCSIKSKPKENQLKSIFYFIEARTFALLAELPLSDKDSKIEAVNAIIHNLKKLSLHFLKGANGFSELNNNTDDSSIAGLKQQIQILADDAPRRFCKP
jgi:hypothetical protein